jgi:thymidylate kinase
MIPNPYPGLFVVFEGCDGGGKSTIREMVGAAILRDLAVKLRSIGLSGNIISLNTTRRLNTQDIVLVKEPGKDRPIGAKIYEELFKPNGLHKTDPVGFQSWYALDSMQNLRENIIPALKASRIVLADRFRHSLVLSAKNREDIERLMTTNQMIIGEYFIWPDVTFILEVDAKKAIERLRRKGVALDEFENEDHINRTIGMYRLLGDVYKNKNIVYIDNSEDDPNIALGKIISILGPMLLKRGFVFDPKTAT